MKSIIFPILVIMICILSNGDLYANLILANPSNYRNFLNSLHAGDTLMLDNGNYINNLTLNGINGTATQPIIIMGMGINTVFLAQSCCNTISITQCSYLIIKNLKVEGNHIQVDAIKAEGTAGNWAHHITLEYLEIDNFDGDQQNVGISTKCPAWDWMIRKNKILHVGTGMYLGNSDGTKPFVNGIIEYNFIAGSIGYNIEIKHQLNNVRDEFPGIAVNGKTIIRHNVFTKDQSSSTGGNARPNLLVGGFPSSGWGSLDYYEIYGNFFFNNPVEALFQGTGNISLYENIFVNHYDPSGLRAVYITPQNGISPQDVKVFHNTVWAANTSGGIRLYNPNTGFKQYCYGNAVFSPSPITNFTDNADNITDSYQNASNYFVSASIDIATLNLYPKAGELNGPVTENTLFMNHTNWDKDFNDDSYDWTFRGAYSGCCINSGWTLQLDTISTIQTLTSVTNVILDSDLYVYPNPFSGFLQLKNENMAELIIELFDSNGKKITNSRLNASSFPLHTENMPSGIYYLQIRNSNTRISRKLIKNPF